MSGYHTTFHLCHVHMCRRWLRYIQSLYNSLKAGVRTFCSSLAYEWADFAHVNSVSRGCGFSTLTLETTAKQSSSFTAGYFGDGMG